MPFPKKAVWSTGAASGSLAVLFVAAACSTPDASPRPSPTVPTITTSVQVSSTPAPSNNAITVQPAPTTEPTVETTTETPPPAPPPPPPPAPPAQTTDPAPRRPRGPFAQQGSACPVEGAVSVNRRLRPMVCTAGNGGKLRWRPV